MRTREEVAAPGMSDFFMGVGVVRVPDVVHQIAYLPCLGLAGTCALDLLNDHWGIPEMSWQWFRYCGKAGAKFRPFEWPFLCPILPAARPENYA